ncbi:hypothetical protein E2C01_053644 [Portunus trituberculatus]|uniref:Uncharacterized protein n=1 Tax=Portunus trituberculatus TaxID=210409 RepID=A0A5B7GHB8_PORTR|nr:hypothetical protein [Portunus trituberculatus]
MGDGVGWGVVTPPFTTPAPLHKITIRLLLRTGIALLKGQYRSQPSLLHIRSRRRTTDFASFGLHQHSQRYYAPNRLCLSTATYQDPVPPSHALYHNKLVKDSIG